MTLIVDLIYLRKTNGKTLLLVYNIKLKVKLIFEIQKDSIQKVNFWIVACNVTEKIKKQQRMTDNKQQKINETAKEKMQKPKLKNS